MKKWMWKKFVLLATLFLGSLFIWNTNASADYRGSYTLKVGENVRCESQGGYLHNTGEYEWWVSNPTVVSVEPEKGNSKYATVTALAPGTATVRVRYEVVVVNSPVWGSASTEERSDNWTFVVEKDTTIQPTAIKLSKNSLKLAVGAGYKLNYTLKPTGASASVSFTSSNSDVASVDMQTGYITARKAGDARITARTSNGKTAVCRVKVTPPAATAISLDKKSLTVEQGKTKKLKATISPAGATGKITWKSSNPKIASVKNGTVKGLKKGTVTITAKLSSKIYAKCKVTVSVKPKSITLNKKKLTLTVGNSAKLTYKLSPQGAKTKASWSSSKKEIASVSKSGNVTAKKAGTATITVKTSNGKKASCKVTVKALKPTSIALSAKSLELEVGKEKKLGYTLTPKKAQAKVTFASSDPKIASVKKDGRVTAKKKGTATITAKTDNGKKASCKVRVKMPAVKEIRLSKTELTMAEGEAYQLKYTVQPALAEGSVSFTSSDSSVVSVGKHDGKITANGPGTATVKAKSSNGVSAACKVTVETYVYLLGNMPDVYLKKGDTYMNEAFAYPTNHTEVLQWLSSNPSVAKVDQNGKVTALSAGAATITVRSRDCEASYGLTVTPTAFADISEDYLYIYDDYYRYGLSDSGEKHPYDPQEGITVIQSNEDRSHSLSIYKEKKDGKPIHVILAGIQVEGEIYTRTYGLRGEGDINLELMEGTHNYVNDSGYGGPLHCLGGNVSISGSGNLELTQYHNAFEAISLMYTNLIIQSGNIKATTKASDGGVICLKEDAGLTISQGAKVTAIGGTTAVEMLDDESTTDIAPGSLSYRGN